MIRPGFVPIVARELGILSRRRATYLARIGLVIAAILALIVITIEGAAPVQGKLLFKVLASMSLAYALIGGIVATSDSLSSEKREGTLGLLFLTHLKGRDVILGKIAASSTSLLYGLLALVPVLAIGFLFGGVTWNEVFRLVVVLISSAMLSLAVGTVVSSFSRDERKAMFASLVLLTGWTIGPYYVRYVRSLGSAAPFISFPIEWFLASPLRAFDLAFVGTAPMMPPAAEFFKSIGALWLIAIGCLATASFVLPRSFQERVRSPKSEKAGKKTRAERQRNWRRRLLDRNPFVWLAGRDRFRAVSVWFFVLSMFVLFGWMLARAPMTNSPDLLAGLAFVIQGVLKIWLLSETCTRFVEDRRAGAYELLLCSPMTVREIARGHAIALGRQFGGPVLLLFIGEFLLVRSFPQPMARWYFGIPAAAFFFDLCALYQIGRWRALFTNSITRAWFQTALRVLLLPWVIYLCYHAMLTAAAVTASGIGTVSPVAPEKNFVVWLCISVAVDLVFALPARWCFFKKFREVAAARFTPKPEAVLAAGEADSAEAAVVRAQRVLRRRRIRRGILAGAGIILLLVAGRHFYAHYRISKIVAAARKAGEPTNMEELRTWGPRVPPENDGILLLASAAAAMPPPMAVPAIARSISPGDEEFLRANLKTLAEIHAALQQTNTSVSMGEMPFQTLMQNGWSIVRIFNAQAEQPDQAWNAAADLFRLRRLIGKAPNWGNEPWRFQILRHGLVALETAASRASSPQSIREMRSVIDSTRDPECWRRRLVAQRCIMLEVAKQPILMFGFGGPRQLRWQTAVLIARMQLSKLTGSFQSGCADLLETNERLIPVTRAAFPDALAQESAMLLRIEQQKSPLPFFDMWRLLGRVNVDRANEEAVYRLADTLLAIAEYRASRGGALPKRLDDLVPVFLKSVPLDPFDGQPLRYRQTILPSGFDEITLYSVGENGVDDGASDNPAPSKQGLWPGPVDIVVRVHW